MGLYTPSDSIILPYPCILSFFQAISYRFPSFIRTPKPYFLSWKNYPSYIVTSDYYLPNPCFRSCFHCPTYLYPVFLFSNIPHPFLVSFPHSPK